ncbi:MFS transporter [Serinibacter salmoneus]|uniref:MFS transporter n=1 Tax=Serinibacter salmoneus TaxID=556530 RepID=UPI001473BD8D|nr:MFS transporter [Serinibacter salmoneus]
MKPPASDTPIAQLPARRKTAVLALCCLPFVMAQLDATIVNVALPTIAKDMHASLSSLQWIVSAYVLVLSSLLLFSGTLADRVGRRKNLIAGIAVFVIGSALCGLSDSVGTLIAARCLQAVGGALISPATLATITTMYPERGERARAIGWWAGSGGVGLALGPLLGGALVESLGWQWVFYVNLLPGVIAIVLCWLFLPESRSPKPRRFDIAGVLLLMVAVFTLAHSIIEGPSYGWTSPVILGGFAVALSVLVAFVLTGLHRPDPVIPPQLFLDGAFTRSVLTVLLGTAALAGLLFTTTLYLQDVRGLSPLMAGVLTLPMVTLSSAGAVIAGGLVAKGYSRALLLSSGLGIAASAAGFWWLQADAVWLIVVPFVLFGAGFGVMNNPVNVTAVSELPDAMAGTAASVVSTFRQFGQVLGVALVGTLMAGHLGSNLSTGFDAASTPVWIMIAACGLGIVALNLRASDPLSGSTHRQHAAPHPSNHGGAGLHA